MGKNRPNELMLCLNRACCSSTLGHRIPPKRKSVHQRWTRSCSPTASTKWAKRRVPNFFIILFRSLLSTAWLTSLLGFPSIHFDRKILHYTLRENCWNTSNDNPRRLRFSSSDIVQISLLDSARCIAFHCTSIYSEGVFEFNSLASYERLTAWIPVDSLAPLSAWLPFGSLAPSRQCCASLALDRRKPPQLAVCAQILNTIVKCRRWPSCHLAAQS